MRISPARLIAPAGVLAVAVLAGLAAYAQQDSPDHRSDSDRPGGTSALRLYAAALGHPAGGTGDSFELDGKPGLLFVFSPDTGFTHAEAAAVAGWVRSGGVLVFAAESGDARLDAVLGLDRAGGVLGGAGRVPGPLLSGVHHLAATPAAVSAVLPAQRQVALVRNPEGLALALMERMGRGTVVAMSEPAWLTNAYIGQADDGILAADLIGLAPQGSPALFDEYHHGLAAAASSQLGWAATPWGAAMIWALVALGAGLFVRGRRFGPLIPLARGGDRSSLEYVAAVGELLRRTAARASSLEVLVGAARRAVAERSGLPGVSDNLIAALESRSPEDARRLAEAVAAVPEAVRSDAALLRTARMLHAAIHPSPPSRPDAHEAS